VAQAARTWFGLQAVRASWFQVHAVVFASFASLIAPFGGFFARWRQGGGGLHLKPGTRNPGPWTLDPQPWTLDPQPYIMNPKRL